MERRALQFIHENESVVAIGLAFFIAAEAVAPPRPSFPAEQIGAGELRRAAAPTKSRRQLVVRSSSSRA